MRIAHPSRSLVLSSSLSRHYSVHFSSFPSKNRFLSFKKRQPLISTRFQRSQTRMADDDVTNIYTNNISALISAEEDSKFGFSRPEMYKSNLAGTVNQYDRHVFLCFKNPDAWLPRVEDSQVDLLPKLLSSAIKARKDDITCKTNVTICEGGEGTQFENGDVLVFPDMIKYKSLKELEVDGFVEDVLVNGKPWASGVQEVLIGSHIFVCAHGSRDKRCGVCGPILIEKLKEGIESRGLNGQVFVSACSHVGGHKYAGNLIIYSPDSEGKIMGHWYGYVTPDDVPEILDQHIGKGVAIERILRGKMGAVTEEAEKAVKQKLPSGKGVKERKTGVESNPEVDKENVGGCCQGANGFSCCRDASSEVTEEKKFEGKGLGNRSSWIWSWEKSEIVPAFAVVGAIATIAVAYSIYKRSG